jgi:hypothetical protein
MDKSISPMEFDTRTADLFEQQPASEKRRLLKFVQSNSITDSDFNPHPATLIALAGVFFYFSSA